MKRIGMFAITALLITGCGSGDGTTSPPSSSPSIVGTWEWGSDNTLVTITFDADGTWHATYVYGSSDEGPWGRGTWEENSDHAPGNVAWSVTNPEDIEIVVGLLGRDYIPDQVFFYGDDGTYKYFHQGTTGRIMTRA